MNRTQLAPQAHSLSAEVQADARPGMRMTHLTGDNNHALLTATFILGWLAGVQVIVAAGWVVNLNLLAAAPIISLLLVMSSAFLYVCHTQQNSQLFARAAFWSMAIGAACLVVAAGSHDFSDDGQTYQQQAIMAVAKGWNPFHEFQYDGKHAIWVSHYAKGPWILSASLMVLSGNIELGKAVNLLLAICAGLVTYGVFRSALGASTRFAMAVAALIAIHPVTNYQLLTYYVDGQVASILAVVALLAYLLAKQRNPLARVALVAAIVVGVNIKFPVAPFVVLICGAVGLSLLVAKQWRQLVVLAGSVVAGLALALFVGFNPYVTNTLTHGHPFYPLAGDKPANILTGTATEEFLRKNRFEKFALSMLSESHSIVVENMGSPAEQIRLKLPFTVRAHELETFYKGTDVRIAGFGPLMSGAVLLVIIYGLVRLAARWRNSKRHTDWSAVSLIAGMVVSAVAMPEFWWARYAPQPWHAAILTVAFLLLAAQPKSSCYLGCAALAVSAVNTLMLLTLSLTHQIVQEADYRAQLGSLRTISMTEPIPIDIKQDSTRLRLIQEGVRFVETIPATCPNADLIIATGSKVCIDDDLRPRYLRGSPFVARMLGRTL